MAINSQSEDAQPRATSQWSLKQVMFGMALLAGFAAVLGYMGFQNKFYWACTIASAIIASVFVGALPFRQFKSPFFVVIIVLVLMVNPCLFCSLVMLCNGLLHLFFSVNVSRRTVRISKVETLLTSMTLTLISFVIGIAPGYSGFLELVDAKKEFAENDLTTRLEYEDSTKRTSAALPDESPKPLSKSYAEIRIDELNQSGRIFQRVNVLRSLHDGTTEMFVKSPGFGVMRMFAPSIDRAKFPEIKNLSFGNSSREMDDPFDYHLHQVLEKSIKDHKQLHQAGLVDFVAPQAWGYIVGPKKTRGFVEHAFHFPIQSHGNDYLEDEGLKLESLQLISLRRFESPMAYDLDHLPRMDQLNGDDPPVRQLSDIESKLLDQLVKNETEIIAVEETPTEVNMLGTIRAFKSCLDCHSGPRDELLGAFTYRFSKTEK